MKGIARNLGGVARPERAWSHGSVTTPFQGVPPKGFTLLELMAALTIIALLSTIGCPNLTRGQSESKTAACNAHKGNIEIQAELWRHNTGSWPATNLSNIGSDVNYFPEGLPTCPVDGSAYTIDSTGRVVGHSH